jgi:hypothetical protein
MQKIKMSQELFDFLKENKTKGIALFAMPGNLQEEFLKIKMDAVKQKKLTWYTPSDTWKECINGICDSSTVYSIKDDVELEKEIEYRFLIPEYITGASMLYVKVLNVGCVHLISTIQIPGFAGFEHENKLGEFLPNMDYRLGKVTRVRFVKE